MIGRVVLHGYRKAVLVQCILSGRQDKMHARRYFLKALDSDQQHMGPALHLVGRVYAVD
jgi:hypothetical protein